MKFTLCKKQYLYIALAIISLVLAITTRAFAEEAVPATYGSLEAPPNGAPASPVENSLPPIKNKLPGYSEVPSEDKGEKGVALEQRVQDRIINLARNLNRKMQSAADRMDKIIVRVDARIVILKGEGVDTTKADESLTIAKNSLGLAKSTLTTLDTSIVNALSSENPKYSFSQLKSQFLVTKEAVRDTHTHLKRTIQFLKESTGTAPATTNPGLDVIPQAGEIKPEVQQ